MAKNRKLESEVRKEYSLYIRDTSGSLFRDQLAELYIYAQNNGMRETMAKIERLEAELGSEIVC